ncbi:cyclase family protein [Streptomyces canus]|uniref:cyclase family protein n=1 Tax=Streptomyces canus TaxID=58343 RepID=UPI00037BC08B|nr:cyclase family protein [Streptomyces canus]
MSALLDAVSDGVRVIDLAVPLFVGMPQSPNHPAFWHTLPRRHGDTVRDDGSSASNDMIVMGTHVGTHIDALAHVSFDGCLHGGVDVPDAMSGGKFLEHGVHTIEPMVTRGMLLDIPRVLGVSACEPGYEITVDDLVRAEELTGSTLRTGDVAVIRSGWGQRFEDAVAFVGKDSGVPGVSEAGARWLAGRQILAAGADTIAFERLPPGDGHAVLPAHKVLLVESGVYIIETMALEELARSGELVFTFVLVPLNIIGATGSPVRPLAVLSR